jgi:hypothetical protein
VKWIFWAVAGLVVTLLVVGLCSSIGGALPRATSPLASRFDPSQAKVVDSRFVSTVKLDGGVVTIRPAPVDMHPKRSELAVEEQVWATGQIMGYRPQAFGFGLVTITKHADGVPPAVNLPAWVGLANESQGGFSCPNMRPSPTRPEPVLPTPGDAAVVIGSSTGRPAVVYRARSAPCGSVDPATLANAAEVISVPWIPNGVLDFEALNVQVDVPRCGGIEGIATGGSAAAMSITVYAVVPESPVRKSCIPRRFVDRSVILGPGNIPGAPPPLVSSSTQILHGPLGHVRVVGASE